MVSEAIKHTACEVNEPLRLLASNRVLNMKLDFARLIATFQVVLPMYCSIHIELSPPAWR
jgi:hypothetical protein